MAGVYISMHSGSISLPTTAVTILQIVPAAQQRVRILSYKLAFDGTNSANPPCRITILRQTSGTGTFATTTTSAVKTSDLTSVAETIQTKFSINAASSEPTVGDILDDFLVPVFGGALFYAYAPGQEEYVPGGSVLGFKLTAQQTVNAYLTVRAEE